MSESRLGSPRRVRIIPVIDVMSGEVVRAVGGRREEYQPVVSLLTRSTDPLEVAKVLIEASGADELYVADLDAIQGKSRDGVSTTVRSLVETTSCAIWLDFGIRDLDDITNLRSLRKILPVFGFETAKSPQILNELVRFQAPGSVAFSIDLRDGKLVGDWQAWRIASSSDTIGLVRQVIERGIRNLIVLDLARVGTGSGCGTEDLIADIRGEFPWIGLISGGGIRDWHDVDRLSRAGADGVLVASALHDGRMPLHSSLARTQNPPRVT